MIVLRFKFHWGLSLSPFENKSVLVWMVVLRRTGHNLYQRSPSLSTHICITKDPYVKCCRQIAISLDNKEPRFIELSPSGKLTESRQHPRPCQISQRYGDFNIPSNSRLCEILLGYLVRDTETDPDTPFIKFYRQVSNTLENVKFRLQYYRWASWQSNNAVKVYDDINFRSQSRSF